MHKNILVTGGAGFIGSHLTETLLSNEETSVVCVDNLFTGVLENINHLSSNLRFSFIKHDITEPLVIKERIDEIYNLACPASPVHYQREPVQTVKANTIGVIHMLELARKHNARILQASTSEIYGDPKERPQKESYWGNVNPIGPRACYDEGKRVAETLFFDYQRFHNLNICVARIFNTFGPRMAANDGRVVSNFIIQALRNEPITVYGDGSQTRSFCYIDDIVEGLTRLMNLGMFTGPVNLGNPAHELPIFDLAKLILRLLDSKSVIEFKPLPEDDPKERQPDISLAQKILGWEPRVPIEEGIKKTIDFFRTHFCYF